MKKTMSHTMVASELDQAREWIRLEAQALMVISNGLDERFLQAVDMIYTCSGAVVVTGIGKAGIIGQKISATLASTGTPSHFLHAAEAVHGDLGRLRPEDVALVLSYSGESEEIVRLIAMLKQLDIPTIAITSKSSSPLGKHSDVIVPLGNIEEICPLGLAPSTSTTCMLAIGDALALSVMQKRNFSAEDYARYHPGGALGRKLITVEQAAMFSPGKPLPKAPDHCTVEEALQQAQAHTSQRHGCILLIDDNGKLNGLLTDGDLRRGIESKGSAIHQCPVREIMTQNPKVVQPDTLASEAMAVFHKHRIDEIPVVDQHHRPVGIIDVQDLVALKIVQ